jgi:nitrogen regulatory protein PII 2
MLVPKRMMTIVVPDADADKVVQTLITANKTGNKGDGKIFVQAVAEAIRIRTGERGADALNLN